MMPKRFTATEKWEDPWFRALSPLEKCAWLYICDRCDAAGFIQLDRPLADFQIGETVSWDAFLARCGNRVEVVDDRYLWIARFVEFQYGTLSPDSRPHQVVIGLLDKRGVLKRIAKAIFKGYPRGIHTPKDKDKEKDKDKTSSSEGGCKGETAADPDESFQRFWKSFPSGRKGSKKEARRAWDKAIADCDPEVLIVSAAEYAESPVGRGKFVKGPVPWLNQGCWEDDRLAWQRNDNGELRREMTTAEQLGIEVLDDQP